MKLITTGTITLLAALAAVAGWLLALFFVAGVWLDCIPNDLEYGCPTPLSALEQTFAALAAATLLTLALMTGARRLNRRR